MKKGLQKTLLILISLCVLISIFNFLVPIDVSANQGEGCYGEAIDDPTKPSGWYCKCGEFVDCWER